MNIYGKKVILRAMEPSDNQMIVEMFNNPDIEDSVIGWAFPISMYAQEQWFASNCMDKNNHRFVIETKEDGAVGIATLTDIDWKNRVAYHGIKLAKKECRAKGIGTDATMAVMRYAFDELQLNRLDGAWFEDNTASKTLGKKCGWIEEGKKRQCVYKKGKYRDVILVGVLASDYYKLIEDNHYWDIEE